MRGQERQRPPCFRRSRHYMYSVQVGFLVSVQWALLLTVKRDTQKERTTLSRKSWGAKAVRVRATGSPRAHPPEVVGHGRRSPRFRNPLIGTLRVASSTSSSVRQSVGRGTGYSHSARKELAAVQTRGSSRAGQLQCALLPRNPSCETGGCNHPFSHATVENLSKLNSTYRDISGRG